MNGYKTRILLVDDHEVVRRGLRAILEMREDFVVVGEASDGREAIERADRLKPDIVVMDIEMPELNGFEATRLVLEKLPHAEVLVLSVHESEQFVLEVLAAGASGYMLKSDAGEDLVSALEALRVHRTFFTSRTARTAHQHYIRKLRGPNIRRRASNELTPRERETLQLLAEGKSNRDVSAQLKISVKTAETHRARIMRKLELNSIADLVRYAIRNGVIKA